MGFTSPEALGLNQRLNIKKQSSFTSYVNPQPADSAAGEGEIRVRNFNIRPTDNLHGREESRVTSRSLSEIIQGKLAFEWDLEFNAKVGGVAGTDQLGFGALLQAAMGGTPSVGAGESTYTLSGLQTAILPLSLTREANQVMLQAAVGAVVDEMEIEISGDADPIFRFRGMARDDIKTAFGTVNDAGGVLTGAVVQFLDASVAHVGSIYAFRTGEAGALKDGPSNAGYRASAVDTTTNLVTFVNASNGAAADFSLENISDGDQCVPFIADDSANDGMVVIPGISGSITFGSTSLSDALIASTVRLKNNIKMYDNVAFQQLAVDFRPSLREVTQTVQFRARRDLLSLWASSTEYQTVTTQMILGTGISGRIIITTKGILRLPPVNFSGIEDEAVVEGEILCKASTLTAEDELAVSFQ